MSLRRLRMAVGEWSPGSGPRLEPLAATIAAWPSIVGADVATNTRPAELVRDTLVVVTRSSAWSQQLSFLSEDVLRGLHAIPELESIVRLRFRVGSLRGNRGGRAQTAPAHARRQATPRTTLGPDASNAEVLAHLRSTVAAQRRTAAACPACGAPRDAPGVCAPCSAAPTALRREATQRLMYDAPWLGFPGIHALVEGLARSEYDAWKAALLARWWEMLLRARWAKRVSAIERRIASSYVLLQSGLEPDRVTPAVVRNLLGDDLAALLDPAASGQTTKAASAGSDRPAAEKKRPSRSTPIP